MGAKKHCTAIALAAGRGKRMGTGTQKQFLDLGGHPLIYYCLDVFERSEIIDDVILVVGKGQADAVGETIVGHYGFDKVKHITEGGKERYDSVWQGILAVHKLRPAGEEGYIFIHDGARPFVDEDILRRTYETAETCRACVAGMPSKDTVKLVNEEGYARETPDRRYVWTVQTPQVFEKNLITEAYSRLMGEQCISVTEDAMVVEREMKVPVKLVEGSYENIKVTTPEDMDTARVFLRRRAGRPM